MLIPNSSGITRRGLLTTVGMGTAAFALPEGALAKMPLGQPQAAYFYRFKLGSAECTIVSDGQLPLGDPNVAFLNITKEEIARSCRTTSCPPRMRC